jgi:hypothetical protein
LLISHRMRFRLSITDMRDRSACRRERAPPRGREPWRWGRSGGPTLFTKQVRQRRVYRHLNRHHLRRGSTLYATFNFTCYVFK